MKLRGYFNPGASDLAIRLSTKLVAQAGSSLGAMVGSSLLLQDPAAMLAEATSMQGLRNGQDNFDEMLILEPKLALVIPGSTQEACQQELTKGLDKDPEHCIQAVKWRRSTHGGRPWARPERLQQDAQAATSRAKLTARPATKASKEAASVIAISFQGGGLGGKTQALVTGTIAKVTEVLGWAPQQGQEGRALQLGEYAADKDEQGGPNGRIRIQLHDPDQAKTVHAELHGTPIWLGHGYVVAHVSNMFLSSFQPGQKNRARGSQ